MLKKLITRKYSISSKLLHVSMFRNKQFFQCKLLVYDELNPKKSPVTRLCARLNKKLPARAAALISRDAHMISLRDQRSKRAYRAKSKEARHREVVPMEKSDVNAT